MTFSSNEPSFQNVIPHSKKRVFFLPTNVLVQVIDKVNISESKSAQVAAVILEKRKRDVNDEIVITELPDSEAEESSDDDENKYSFAVRDSSLQCFNLIFEEDAPTIGIGAELEIYEGCKMWRKCIVAGLKDFRIVTKGKELSEDGILLRFKDYL